MRSSLLLAGVLAVGVTLWTAATRSRASDRWIEAMRARGEAFTIEELGLHGPAEVDPGLDTLLRVASRLQVLKQAAVAEPHPGPPPEYGLGFRVGWKEPRLYSSTGHVMDWEVATRLADDVGPVCSELHAILHGPLRDPGMDYPETLEELVPGLIEELPQDPISGQPLCYRRQTETRFALASDWFDAPEHLALDPIIWPRAAQDPTASPRSPGDEICPEWHLV